MGSRTRRILREKADCKQSRLRWSFSPSSGLQSLYGLFGLFLYVFFLVTLGEETPIFVPLTLRRRVSRYRHVNISGWKPDFGENGHKWKDNIYRAYIGPYYREINPVGPVYLYLGIRNRGVEALSGVFDSHLLSNGVHSLSLVHDLTIHWVGSNPGVFGMYVLNVFSFFCLLDDAKAKELEFSGLCVARSCILILTKVTRMTDLDVTLYPYPHSSVVTQYWVVGLVSGWDHLRFVQNNFFINVYKTTGLEVPISIVLSL